VQRTSIIGALDEQVPSSVLFRLLGSPTSPYSTALVDMFVRLAALVNKPVYDDIFYISSYIALALHYLHFLLACV